MASQTPRRGSVRLLAGTERILEHGLVVVAGIGLKRGSLLVLLPTQLQICSSKPSPFSFYCFSSSKLRMILPLFLVHTTFRIEPRTSPGLIVHFSTSNRC